MLEPNNETPPNNSALSNNFVQDEQFCIACGASLPTIGNGGFSLGSQYGYCEKCWEVVENQVSAWDKEDKLIYGY